MGDRTGQDAVIQLLQNLLLVLNKKPCDRKVEDRNIFGRQSGIPVVGYYRMKYTIQRMRKSIVAGTLLNRYFYAEQGVLCRDLHPAAGKFDLIFFNFLFNIFCCVEPEKIQQKNSGIRIFLVSLRQGVICY